MHIGATFILLLSFTLSTPHSPLPDGKEGIGQATGTFFALSVADVALQSAWYRDKLGLRIISQGEAPNKIAKFALLEGEGLIIELIQHRDAKTRAEAAPTIKQAYELQGIFKVGALVKDLDRVYREVKAKGVPIAYDLMRAKDVPLRSFSIRDAEGNYIQFFGQ
jgi:catechol 2,3-dioxygenase-like lactoylglutathione lyase family enzyme